MSSSLLPLTSLVIPERLAFLEEPPLSKEGWILDEDRRYSKSVPLLFTFPHLLG